MHRSISETNQGIRRLCVIAVGIALPASAFAALEEVIVTATKRGELLIQNIPAGISAISEESIEQFGVRGFDEIARLEPSLRMASQGVGDSQLIIRGIQSPGESTVGLYLDETVLSGANFQDGGGRTPAIRMYDIGRIEVLKGPQGTLFGANSMSGTVRIITNKADAGKFDARVSGLGMSTEDGDEGYDVNGMINIPIIPDVLAIRGVAYRVQEGGFIDQVVGANGLELDDVNEVETTGGRINVRWTPNEDLTVSAFGVTQDTEVDGSQFVYPFAGGVLVPIDTIVPPAPFPFTWPPRDGITGDRKLTKPGQEPFEDDIDIYGATIEYDLGFGTVLGTASYFDRNVISSRDTTPTALQFFLPFGVSMFNQFQDRSVLSTEVRFSSNFDGPFNFVAGFFHEWDDTYTNINVLVGDDTTGIPACSRHKTCLAAGLAEVTSIFSRQVEFDRDYYALFVHGDYEVTEKITLGGGIRYYDSDQRNLEYTLQDFPPPPLFNLILGIPLPSQTMPVLGVDDTASEDKVTFDATLAYKHTEDQNYYFRAATGFRPGGINDTSFAQVLGIAVPTSFDPDTVLSVEVGAKTSWLEDRVRLNVAYFHMFWDDVQVFGEEPSGAFEYVTNAAKADVDGIEMELFAQPTEPLYLTFGFTWLDARLSADQEVPEGIIAPPGFPLGKDGDPLQRVPEWAVTGSAQYEFPFTLLPDAKGYFRLNFAYTGDSETFFNDLDQYNTKIGDYVLVDLNASVVYRNWEFKVFLNNATDEAPIMDSSNGIDGPNVITARPRTVGIQLSWDYD